MSLPLLALLACGPDGYGDDAPSGEDELSTPGGEAEGKLALDRDEVLADAVCGTRIEVITLSNVGDGVLELDTLALDGEGWTLPAVDLPLFIQPGAGHELELTAASGEAELSISGPTTAVRVPLSATSDQAPVVSLTSPAASAVVDVGETLTLEAWVTDDADAPEDLTVRWRSDLDGEVDAYPPLPDGLISAKWIGRQRTPATHTLTLSVTDSCGNEVLLEAAICQEGGFATEGSEGTGFEFAGPAGWLPMEEALRLTPNDHYQTGAAFMTDYVASAGEVDISFDFFVGGGTGADGFALTALDADRMVTLLGNEGCGLGYGDSSAGCIDGIDGLPGWSIEVDTYYNPEIDASEADHLAMSIDGDQTETLFYVELPEIEDTGWHSMSVTTSGSVVTVVIDGTTRFDGDVGVDLAFDAYVGFTAATGGDTNDHLIEALTVREGLCSSQ
ncbi:MAG TPA: L-type lectin-domain containing protein [Myxococcota bacterium]|nr:L-type lectin-domain containing protein [Myxococcota bacterium]